MANNTVLIVGAGPTGMTAAIELKRLGMDVRIIDKSDHMARYSQAWWCRRVRWNNFRDTGLRMRQFRTGAGCTEPSSTAKESRLWISSLMQCRAGILSRYLFHNRRLRRCSTATWNRWVFKPNVTWNWFR